MALILIGTGVAFDLTLSSIEELKKCDEIYIERYTNPISEENITSLEKSCGKKINLIERNEVESDFLIKKASGANIVLLCSGDPLIATTHISLLIDAKKQNIKTKIIHNSSIYTAAIGKSGLQAYRFGKSASLVNPRENYKPTSSLDIIRENLARNLHTLVFLDTEPEPMTAKTALEFLKEFETVVILSRIGENDEKILVGDPKNLMSKVTGKPPFIVIVPAKLHPVEEEYLAFYQK